MTEHIDTMYSRPHKNFPFHFRSTAVQQSSVNCCVYVGLTFRSVVRSENGTYRSISIPLFAMLRFEFRRFKHVLKRLGVKKSQRVLREKFYELSVLKES